jgi:eukaryotic-like serine/threonine-protein kinase
MSTDRERDTLDASATSGSREGIGVETTLGASERSGIETTLGGPERDIEVTGGPTAGVETRRLQGAIAQRLFASAAAPLRIGRFEVLERLGAGAMGEVYRAEDPQLQREVAVKVLRKNLGSSASDRMLVEGRALARLDHPNVVPVYDIGFVGEQVFVAMGYVRGQTLRQWIRPESGPRSVEDTLVVFRAAAEGLAHAHAHGIVHRDFKPDNVLVSDDGMVRVADFGLAAPAKGPVGAVAERSVETAPQRGEITLDLSRSRLTDDGEIVGTPAYMAPEQLAAKPAEPQTDQFAFCIALWEALYGVRPFSGQSLPELVATVLAGDHPPPPARALSGERVPRRVRRALVRGLRPVPGRRWPDMQSLGRALSPRSTRARVAVGAGLGGAALTSAAVLGFAWLGPSDPDAGEQCREATRRAEAEWKDQHRPAVARGFDAVDRPFARDTAHRTLATLDEWMERWRQAHESACAATYDREEQTAVALELRRACLGRKLTDTLALARILASEIDETVLARTDVALRQLPDPQACADVASLAFAAQRSRRASPEDAERVEDQIGHGQGLGELGKYDDAIATLTRARDDARALDDPGLVAAASLQLGRFENSAGRYAEAEADLRAALESAADVGAVDVEARAWHHLLTTITAQGKYERAEGIVAAGEVALRKTTDPRARAAFANARAALYLETGRAREAEASVRDALAMLEEAGLEDDYPYASYLNTLSAAISDQGRHDEAVATYQRTIEVFARNLAPDHPLVAAPLSNLGLQHQLAGDLEAALRNYERALQLWTGAYGHDHPNVATAHDNIGVIAQYRGQSAEAKLSFERSLEIRSQTLGPRHIAVAHSHNNLGWVAFSTGAVEDARDHWEHARSILVENTGPDSFSLIDVDFNLASLATSVGEHETALAILLRTAEIIERAGSSGHPSHARTLVGIANAYRQLGRCTEAEVPLMRAYELMREGAGLENLEGAHLMAAHAGCLSAAGSHAEAERTLARAASILQTQQVSLDLLGRVQSERAQELWVLGRRNEAIGSARDAVETYRGFGDLYAHEIENLERWIAAR